MTEQTNDKIKYLAKDLKKIITISLILLIILIILAVVNLKTNFLLDFTDLLMGKILG